MVDLIVASVNIMPPPHPSTLDPQDVFLPKSFIFTIAYKVYYSSWHR